MNDNGTEQPDHPSQAHIQIASAWVLRVGVLLSVAVMLTGLGFSLFHGTVSESARIDVTPAHLRHGIASGSGRAMVELGILLLVMTPVMRVATSMVLFAFSEHDYLYAMITLVVLLMTLAGLLFA